MRLITGCIGSTMLAIIIVLPTWKRVARAAGRRSFTARSSANAAGRKARCWWTAEAGQRLGKLCSCLLHLRVAIGTCRVVELSPPPRLSGCRRSPTSRLSLLLVLGLRSSEDILNIERPPSVSHYSRCLPLHPPSIISPPSWISYLGGSLCLAAAATTAAEAREVRRNEVRRRETRQQTRAGAGSEGVLGVLQPRNKILRRHREPFNLAKPAAPTPFPLVRSASRCCLIANPQTPC